VDDQWQARIKEVAEVSKMLTVVDIASFSEIEQKDKIAESIQNISASFDLQKGDLFQCLYFHGGTQRDQCVFIAHHLIIDNVSWQIITEEFSTMLQQAKASKALTLDSKTISYKKWAQVLQDLKNSAILQADFEYWKKAKEGFEEKPFPVDMPTTKLPVPEDSIANIIFELDEQETTSILKDVATSYGVKANEVLLTAFLMATNTWKGIHQLCIEMEGHGRESIVEDLEFFNSIGWFTTVFPAVLTLDREADAGANLKKIKDQVRNIPNKGLTYGVLKYLSDQQEAIDQIALSSAIVFNYLGVENQGVSEILGPVRKLSKDMRNAKSERHHLLEFNVSVIQQKLQVNCAYSKEIYELSTIEHLLKLYEHSIKDIIENCSSSEDHSYSPSDFPDADVSQNDLDALFGQL